MLLSTCTVDAVPEISYAPYTVVGDKLYILISDLALHTGNLKANPRASLLFIESEDQAENYHARKRLTYKVDAKLVTRESIEWQNAIGSMKSRFGEIIAVLESLPDFHLFEMTTTSAVLVRGFADAHVISCDGFAGL